MAKPFSADDRILIVGASHAGVSMADQLRRNGFEGAVTLADREQTPPMERPPLSKAWLSGGEGGGGVPLRQPAWYGENGIDLRLGVEIVGIDISRRVAECGDGTKLEWDGLVIATGAVPKPLPIPGGDGPSVHYLRVPADASRLSAAFGKASSLVVVGGGYIGLEVAASARKRGLEVTVIEAAPRLLARVASPEASAFFESLHKGEGVRVLSGENVTAIEPDGSGARLVTEGGGEIAADVVVAGIGVAPDTALAKAAGLKVGDGIAVDGQYRTEVEGVFAIGDSALPEGGFTGGSMRIESVHHAQMSAEIAAAAMMSRDKREHEVPWFWSDQFDASLQSAGIVPAGAKTVTRPGRREGGVSFWSFADGALAAVEAVNDAQAYMLGRRIMEGGIALGPDEAADGGFDLKALLSR